MNSKTTSSSRDLPYDTELSERKTAQEEEIASIRNELATKKERIKENDKNLTSAEVTKKAFENLKWHPQIKDIIKKISDDIDKLQ